jgi:hypothetical protein
VPKLGPTNIHAKKRNREKNLPILYIPNISRHTEKKIPPSLLKQKITICFDIALARLSDKSLTMSKEQNM